MDRVCIKCDMMSRAWTGGFRTLDSSLDGVLFALIVAIAVSLLLIVAAVSIAWRLLCRAISNMKAIPNERHAGDLPNEKNPPGSGLSWWVWPSLGLAVGVIVALLAALQRRRRQESKWLDPARAHERLTSAYSPLLMRINMLPFSDVESDEGAAALRNAYIESVRPLLYEQAHLLSERVLSAAAKLDAGCSEPIKRQQLVRRARVLQEQIVRDHRLLRNLTDHDSADEG